MGDGELSVLIQYSPDGLSTEMSLQELAGLSIVPTETVGASVVIDSVGVRNDVEGVAVLRVVTACVGTEVGDCVAVSENM